MKSPCIAWSTGVMPCFDVSRGLTAVFSSETFELSLKNAIFADRQTNQQLLKQTKS